MAGTQKHCYSFGKGTAAGDNLTDTETLLQDPPAKGKQPSEQQQPVSRKMLQS